MLLGLVAGVRCYRDSLWLGWSNFIRRYRLAIEKVLGLAPQTFDDPANVLFANAELLRDLALRPALTPIQINYPPPEAGLNIAYSGATGKNCQQGGPDSLIIPRPQQIATPLL